MTKKRKKLLIVYNYILHYRVSFFEELSKYYDLTVLHSGCQGEFGDVPYNEIIVPVRRFGPFYWQSGIFPNFSPRDYDFVVLLFDLRWISSLLFFIANKSSVRIVLWGAWLTKSRLANIVRLVFMKKSFANIFYSQNARKDFIRLGLNENSCFVANNTFKVPSALARVQASRDSFLFVGSLDERKRLDVCIKQFSKIVDYVDSNIELNIVGSGSQEAYLKSLVSELGLSSRVLFRGRINDVEMLAQYYNRALACVSFAQAGLGVLQSLGYGVPFICDKGAISGGEIYNIKHGYNGFLLDSQSDMSKFMLELIGNPGYAKTLRENALSYYQMFCTVENMASGFADSFEGTRRSVVDIREDV